MRNSKKKNYCLIAALASLVAFSTMAASVMSGCGENSDEQKTTKIVHETRIDTQVETRIETYTEVVTDAQGNTEYVEETKAVPVNSDKADSNGNSSDKSESSANNNKGSNNGNNNSNNNSSNNSEKIDFNDELKKQIAVAGEAYVEFYFEYGEGTAPSAFAEQAYEDTENDTPLGQYKEQGKTIFMNAFKEAYEATGNEYY